MCRVNVHTQDMCQSRKIRTACLYFILPFKQVYKIDNELHLRIASFSPLYIKVFWITELNLEILKVTKGEFQARYLHRLSQRTHLERLCFRKCLQPDICRKLLFNAVIGLILTRIHGDKLCSVSVLKNISCTYNFKNEV